MKSISWFAISFACTLAILVFANPKRDSDPNDATFVTPPTLASGLVLPQSGIFDVKTRDLVENVSEVFEDGTVVILLGSPGCYPSQREVLQWWQDQLDNGEVNRVVALVADPLLGIEQNTYDALVLRRVSGAKFQFLVSTNSDFDLRSMRIPLPQVITAEDGRISSVLEPPDHRAPVLLSR